MPSFPQEKIDSVVAYLESEFPDQVVDYEDDFELKVLKFTIENAVVYVARVSEEFLDDNPSAITTRLLGFFGDCAPKKRPLRGST